MFIENKKIVNHTIFGVMMLCIVGGSHIGMLWLSNLYASVGRVDSAITPESVFGGLAILALLVMTIWRLKVPRLSLPMMFLGGFALSSILSEFFRSNIFDVSTVTLMIALFSNSVIGYLLGKNVVSRSFEIPYLKILLAIYFVWYLGLLGFLIRGDLGFYGVLPGTSRLRLEFLSGYSATEIPVYMGFHLPVILYSMLRAGKQAPLWKTLPSVVLLGCAAVLAYSSASSAVIIAILLIALIFYASLIAVNIRALTLVGALVFALSTIVSFSDLELFQSSSTKLDSIQHGEGVRGLAYSALLQTIASNPFGIGLRQFQYQNNFSWTGEGIYPHNNLLGIGAELGTLPLIFYVLFLLSSLFVLGKWALQRPGNNFPKELRLAVSISLSVLLYQQFRGFFQDTWAFKELYLWVGLGLGVCSNSGRFSTRLLRFRKNVSHVN